MVMLMGKTIRVLLAMEIVRVSIAATITVNPQNTTVLKGNKAQFMCVVDDLGHNQIVKWFRNNEVIATGMSIVQELSAVFTIDMDKDLGHHNLILNKAKREDNGTKYYCAVYEGNVEKRRSVEAYLTVNEVPNIQYPECSSGQFSDGYSTELICLSEKVHPPVKLQWYRNGKELKSRINHRLDQVRAVFTVDISKEDNAVIFVCSLTTDACEDWSRNCSIGPINVLYKPSPEIHGPNILYKGKDGVYVCHSNARPDVVDYKWKIPSYISKDKYAYENDGRVLRLIGFTKSDNGTAIECTTRNSEGEGTATFMIMVNSIQSVTLTNGIEGHPTGSSSVTSSSTAAMLSVVGGCLLFLASIMAFLLCSIILYSRRHAGLYSGNHVPQPDVYYVPKDSIDTTSGTTYQTGKWKRSIATQVPNDLELESITYAEIEEGKKLINSYRTLKIKSTNVKEDTK